jgi:hypothetical protein
VKSDLWKQIGKQEGDTVSFAYRNDSEDPFGYSMLVYFPYCPWIASGRIRIVLWRQLMKRILNYLEKRTAEMQEHPFLVWLADPSIPARERLSDWLPCAAFFVFSFMDLNADVLKYSEEEADADPLKKAINAHLEEDSMHWPWYLHDLKALGLDRTMTFSDTLRFLWGKETRSQRLAMYRLCALGSEAEDPILRYALIASLEAVAHLLFSAVVKVSIAYEQDTGTRLLYLGPKHFEREPGHLTHQQDDAADALQRVTITSETCDRATAIAAAVCEVIDDRWREFHRVVLLKSSRELATA